MESKNTNNSSISSASFEINLEKILTHWKFPISIIENYRTLGIKEIFKWQTECLHHNQVLEGKKNLVYSAPTSAGKTLVAELLMLKNVLSTRRKAILIFPYVSLAKEKLKHLQWLLTDSYLKADGFIGNMSPNGGFNAVDIAVCTIEKANSLLNRLIEDELIFELGIVVVDELHMVNDQSRGYLLELILTKIKYLCLKVENKSKIQMIGMSATLPNLRVLSNWLDAHLYQTDFRPISLVEALKFENNIYDKDKNIVSTIKIDTRIENDADLLVHLVLETIVNKFGVLVFCPTKSRCEVLAENIARSIYSLEKYHGETLSFLNKDKIIECLNELKNTPAGLDPQLGKTVRYGIAFHHAGLTVEEREIVENHFKQGSILVILCTSTLSSGINFPARRVIIRTPIFNGKPIDIMSYKQMAGRAGRKGIDTCGESILMCSNLNEKKIGENLLNSSIPEISANMNQKSSNTELLSSVKRALLETIVSGIASRKEDIIQYTMCTLANQFNEGSNDYIKYLEWLNTNHFIDTVKINENNQEFECYKPSQLAYAVVSSSMSPDEGLVIFSELQKALQCFVLENELHIIYQITPINICDYWINSSSHIDWNLFYTLLQNFPPDVKRVCDLVGVRQSFILKMIKSGSSSSTSDNKLLKIHLRFFTALILNDLVNEVPYSAVLSKYSCQKGFLQTLQQSSSTYAAMITVFCNRLGWYNLELLVNQFQSRLAFGVQRQLLDLIRIKLLNSHRARLFYNAGLTTVALIAMSDLKKIEKILRSSHSFSSKQSEQGDKNGEYVIWHDGIGYTYWQAASIILQEANELLKNELEQMGLKVSLKKEENPNKTSSKTFLFDFNETFDSMIQSQSKNSKAEVPVDAKQLTEEQKIDVITEEKEEVTKIEEVIQKEEFMVPQPPQIEPVLIETKEEYNVDEMESETQMLMNLNQTKLEGKKREENLSNSYIDDQFMLEAVETFEKNDKHEIDKSKMNSVKTPKSKRIDEMMNTTVVSDDVLEICEIFEKNVLSGKKSAKKTPKAANKYRPVVQSRKSINFPLGDQTINDILNSSIVNNDEKPDVKNEFRICSESFLNEITKSLEILSNPLDIKINFIQTEEDMKAFTDTIKAKCIASISIACEKLNPNENTEIPESDNFLKYHDKDKNINIKFYGIFFCLEIEKYKKIHFVFLNNHKSDLYIKMLKNILEKEDFLIKISFFTKQHFKLFNRVLNINISTPCYDPIIANWLLFQEVLTIFQIKQKFCPSLNILIDNYLRNCKSCYGCSLSNKPISSTTSVIQRAFIESLIGVHCFEKIKLQLQLQNLWIYFAKIESDVVLQSANLELFGMGIDLDQLQNQKNLLLKKKKEIEEKVHLISGRNNINLNSPDEVASVLYDKLKLKPLIDATNKLSINSNDKLKHHSTSKDVLIQMSAHHELPKLIILWRKISHTLSSSVYPLERAKVFQEQFKMYRVHPTVDLFTMTGRMNFFDPCLQMIPRDFDLAADKSDILNVEVNCLTEGSVAKGTSDEESAFFMEKMDEAYDKPSNQANNVSLRSLFIPSEDRIILTADYSQLELRIIANLCKDETFIAIFNDTKNDVFNLLASKWLNIPLNQVDEEKRQNVKKIIYGIIYGISPKTLSMFLNLSENEAASFIDSFKSTFPGLKKFIINQIEICRQKGYVETIRKRRRHFLNINSNDIKIRAQAERQAINTLVQGSATDLVKSSMVKIEKALKRKFSCFSDLKRGAFLIMQLHDELIYEVNKLDIHDVELIVRECMENCFEFPVKMKTKIKIGSNWGSLTPINNL